MIAEIRFKNMFSFRDEAILSFEADRSKDMESYHVVELGGGVRLLKVAVICLLYTSDAADDKARVALGGRRIIKK